MRSSIGGQCTGSRRGSPVPRGARWGRCATKGGKVRGTRDRGDVRRTMDPGGAASRGAGWARAHISVVVVDDHEMVAEALFHALADEPDIQVVGRAGPAPARPAG